MTRRVGSKSHISITTKYQQSYSQLLRGPDTDPLRFALQEQLTFPALTHTRPCPAPRKAVVLPTFLDDHCTILSSMCDARGEHTFSRLHLRSLSLISPGRTHSFVDSSKDRGPAPLSGEASTCLSLNSNFEENFKTFRTSFDPLKTRKPSDHQLRIFIFSTCSGASPSPVTWKRYSPGVFVSSSCKRRCRTSFRSRSFSPAAYRDIYIAALDSCMDHMAGISSFPIRYCCHCSDISFHT